MVSSKIFQIIIIIIKSYTKYTMNMKEYEKRKKNSNYTRNQLTQTACTRENIVRKTNNTVCHHNQLLKHTNLPFNIVVTVRYNSIFVLMAYLIILAGTLRIVHNKTAS